METKVEALQDNQVKVTITVEAKDIDARIKKTYKDFANKYTFPGFRKGKAPRPVIDNALGAEAVRATVTDDVVNEAYPLAIEQTGIFPVGKPEFEDTDLVENGKDYTFVVTVPMRPEYELSSYDPIEIEMPSADVTAEEIDEQIEGLRDHYFSYKNAPANTKVKADSTIDMAVKATDDDGKEADSITSESRLYTLGSGALPKTFDDEIIGLKKGDTKQFKIDMPAEDCTLTEPLRGRTACITFDVEVQAVKKKVLPDLTDEWVKDVMGFDTIAELRERIETSLKEQKDEVLPRIKETLCMNQLCDRLQGEVPESLVEENEASLMQDFFQQIQRQGITFDGYLKQQGITSDQFKEDLKMQALDVSKQDLALDAWARHFDMAPTEEEIAAEFAASGVDDPVALQKDWVEAGRMHMVRGGMARTKAVYDVLDTAIVKPME